MSAFMKFLGPLLAALPSLVEAKRILTDKAVAKENQTKISTALGTAGIGAAGVLAIDPATPPEVVVGTLVASLILYFSRRAAAS